MNFAADCYFHIGHVHLNVGKPCQDYTCAGVYKGAAYAVVSDGCTTGGETDVGARVLALATASAIRKHRVVSGSAQGENIPLEIRMRQELAITGTREMLGLLPQDMRATCVYAYLSQEGGFVHLAGDGVVGFKEKNGRVMMSRFDWLDNRPFYPAYTESDVGQFVQDHGGDLCAKRLKKFCWEWKDGAAHQPEKEEFTLAEGMRGITIPITQENLTNLQYIAVFSDGVVQVEGLDWKDVVVQLLAFKTVEGDFAKRRMMRAIKDTRKIGKGPLDDISYAVIRIIHEEGDAA